MAEPYSISNDQQRASIGPARPCRPRRPYRAYLWGLAAWLKNGATAAAFYLAWHTGTPGALALAAFLGGVLLREFLELSSAGD